MTGEGNALNFLGSGIGGIISIIGQIFHVLISFLPAMLGYIIQLFGFIIFIIPLIMQGIVFALSHFYIILIIAECLILVRVIVTAGFMEKLSVYFNTHVLLITWIFKLPFWVMDFITNMIKVMQTIFMSLFFVWDIIKGLMSWIVQAGSSNLVTGIILFAGLIAGLIALMLLVHI